MSDMRFMKEPPSVLTMALHEKGWTWNLDWTWTDPATGRKCTILAAKQKVLDFAPREATRSACHE